MALLHENVARCRDGESVSKVCRALKAANVDRVVTLSQNRPSCS